MTQLFRAWQGSWHGGDVMCDSDGGGGAAGGTWQGAINRLQKQLQWEMSASGGVRKLTS